MCHMDLKANQPIRESGYGEILRSHSQFCMLKECTFLVGVD